MKFVARLTICVLAAFLFGAAAPRQQAAGKRYLLAVGVDSYDDASISTLHFSVADVRGVSDALKDTGFDQVVTLTSDQADLAKRPTRGNVLDRLQMFSTMLKPEDTFVFYFSGHGFQREQDCYLATVDARIATEDLLTDTALPLETLKRRMKNLQARNRVFIIDACRNDPVGGGKGDDNVRTASFSKELILTASASVEGQAATAVIFACSVGERSWEYPEYGHGAFTHFLLDAFGSPEGVEADGTITSHSLMKYIQSKMAGWRLATGRHQTPDMMSNGGADVSLGKPSRTSASAKQTSTLATMRFTVLDAGGKAVLNPSISVDGKAAGSQPTFDLEDQKTRNVEVTVKADGFKAAVLQVTLERGKELPVEVKLEAKAAPGASPGSESLLTALGTPEAGFADETHLDAKAAGDLRWFKWLIRQAITGYPTAIHPTQVPDEWTTCDPGPRFSPFGLAKDGLKFANLAQKDHQSECMLLSDDTSLRRAEELCTLWAAYMKLLLPAWEIKSDNLPTKEGWDDCHHITIWWNPHLQVKIILYYKLTQDNSGTLLKSPGTYRAVLTVRNGAW